MATRRSSIPTTPVSDSVAAILLGGWGADPPDGRDHGFGDGVFALMTGEIDSDDVWREHESYLRELAKRWRWKPRYWIAPPNEYHLRFVMDGPGARNEGPFFFAEAHAIAGPQRA